MPSTRQSLTGLERFEFPSNEGGVLRAPVLLCGRKRAMLLNGGLTFGEGEALVRAIVARGKRLTTIFITHPRPEFYFGLKPVLEAFRFVDVLAATATLDALKKTIHQDLLRWVHLADDGPRHLLEVVLPTPFDESTLVFDGHAVDLSSKGLDQQTNHHLVAPATVITVELAVTPSPGIESPGNVPARRGTQKGLAANSRTSPRRSGVFRILPVAMDV